jgi:ABC-type branched-subunit amino acid transport system permease subunit
MMNQKKSTQSAQSPLARGWNWLLTAPQIYVILAVYIAVTTLGTFENERSLPIFLLFEGSLLLIFYARMSNVVKLIYGGLVLLVLLPILGLRNVYYLEVATQIGIYMALALGLNIVVGFAGLLDLGYVAFYAVGAYVWAIFGSAHANAFTAPGGLVVVAIGLTAAALTGFLSFAGVKRFLAAREQSIRAPWSGVIQWVTPLVIGLLLYALAWGILGPSWGSVGRFPLPAWWFFVFLFIAVGVTALAGILLGTPVLRLRGDYLAIVTLGFGEVIRVLAKNLDKPVNITNGSQGITPVTRPPLPPEPITASLRAFFSQIAGRPLQNPDLYGLYFFLLALIIAGIAIFLARRLDESHIGRAWTAIREDEQAAIAMGVPLVRMKLMAFAAGASFAGAMGMIFAAKQTFVNPDSFTFMESIGVLAMVILGGMGSIPGAILGATIVTVLNLQVLTEASLQLSALRQSGGMIPLLNIPWSSFPNQLEPAKYQRMVFGIVLIVMMVFRPEGILPARRRRMEIAEALHGEAESGEPPAGKEK